VRKTGIRRCFQTVFVLLSGVVLLAPGGGAQEWPSDRCPVHSCLWAASPGDDSLWLAQLGEQEPGWGRDSGREGKMMQRKYRKHIEQFRLLKLLELLDLGDDQEVDFVTAFHSMRRERSLLHQQKTALVDELAEGLRTGTIPDDEINRLIRQISELRKQEARLMEEFLEKSRKILFPAQLGRLIVFQERFELELLESVKVFRERRPRPGKLPPTGETQP